MNPDTVALARHVADLLNKFLEAQGSFPPDQEEQVEQILKSLAQILRELLSERSELA